MRKMGKRGLCVALLCVLLTGAVVPAFAATSYRDLIGGILDDLSTNNAQCNGALQQQVNGLYRLTEMLAVIALEGDTTGRYASIVSDVLDSLSSQNSRASGAPQ